MYSDTSKLQPKSVQSHPGASRKLGTLLQEISDDSSDEDYEDAEDDSDPIQSSKPWLAKFNGYLHS